MDRNQTLDTAKAAVNRAPKSYGNPREHFERVARHWNAHLQSISSLDCTGAWHVPDLKPTDIAIMLGQVKIARLEHDPQHEDSWCDWAGYAACGAEVSEPDISYKVTIKTGEINPNTSWRSGWGSGDIVEFSAKPGETTHQAADRAMREGHAGLSWNSHWFTPQTVRIVPAPPQEPAWKRAKVGDRIRIREGAQSYAGVLLPKEVVVGRTCTLAGWRCEGHAVGEWRSIRDEDVLEILPPLPESKFGFTVGETVNYVGCPKGSTPGKVTGFSDVGVNVRWSNGGEWLDCGPSLLRHGA